VEGVGAAEIREIADGTLAHTISRGSQDDALHVGAKKFASFVAGPQFCLVIRRI
jgi:hypothetical protein